MKKTIQTLLLFGIILFTTNYSIADTINVYINNNNQGYNQRYNNSGIMCSDNGGFCTNGYYIMSSSRVRYAAPRWKRATIRERRLSMENGYLYE